MRVLFLTHSFPRYTGDAPGSFLHRLAVALCDTGVEVRVIAPAADNLPVREELDGIHVERFRYAPKGLETLAYTGNMAQEVAGSWSARFFLTTFLGSEFIRSSWESRAFKPDVIHAHWWFPSGVVAMSLAGFSRVTLVTTLHGTDLRLAVQVRASRPVMRQVLRRSKRVTTVSQWLASELRKIAPDAEPVVAPMPVAVEKFEPGGSRERNRFLFAGRLNKQKGLEYLLRAFAAMHGPAMLDVVGQGSDAARLKLLASQLGVSDRVAWHGQVAQTDLVRMYQSATAVIVPSVDEGLGLVAAEALLCQTPVIAFRSGGLTDIVHHERTGILVNPGVTAELTAALENVLAFPEQALALAAAGRRHVLATLSPERAAETYARVYREAIGERQS